jgi:hypothetical protein
MPGGGKYSYYSDSLPVSKLGLPGTKGVSNQTLMKSLYVMPKGTDMKGVQDIANALMLPDKHPVNPDPSILTDDDIKQGFGAAPDVPKDVTVTRIGDPANAYFPNLESPGEGVTSPVVPRNDKPEDINVHAVVGVDGLLNPAVTSNQMSNATKVGTKLQLGKRPGSVDKA